MGLFHRQTVSLSPPQSAFYTCYLIHHSGKARGEGEAEWIDRKERKQNDRKKKVRAAGPAFCGIQLGNGGIRSDCMEREGRRCERSGSQSHCMRGLLVRNEQREAFIRLLLSCPLPGL